MAFAPALGAAIWGAASSTAGITALAVGGGLAASNLMNKQPKADNTPIPLPQPPSIATATDSASKIIQQRRAAMSQTIFTNPLGISGSANVARKTLLGQ